MASNLIMVQILTIGADEKDEHNGRGGLMVVHEVSSL